MTPEEKYAKKQAAQRQAPGGYGGSARVERAPEPGRRPGCVALGQGMLPDPEHTPAGPAQEAVDLPVAAHVAENLFPPEPRVLFRPRRMNRAPVPEAAVDEDASRPA